MVRRHDWRDLCAAGFAIPKVSLVRLDEPLARRLLGWRVLARRLVVAKAPEASASGSGRAYPSVESLDVRHVSHRALALAAAPGPGRSISIGPDPRAAWAAIAGAARGEFLALLRPGESGSDLGAAVAVLMRTPVLDAVARRDGLRLVRRSALATIVSQAGRRASGRGARWSAPRRAVRHGS
jgi:hypothetical protein